MTANDSQDFAHEFTPTNRFGRTRPNLSTTLPRFSKTRAGSYPLGQCTVTSRHRLPPPGGRQCLAPNRHDDRLGWAAGIDLIDGYAIPALNGSQPS
jgi:hypothetical protein